MQRLIDAIDQERNAALLRVGYFNRRRRSSLPHEEGFAIVQAAIAKEPVATKRWFILQNLRAHAAFRMSELSTDEGFAAYNDVLDSAPKATVAKASYQLQQAINELVTNVSTRFDELGLTGDERTNDLMFKAWNTYVAYVLPYKAANNNWQDPSWGKAVEEARLTEKFLPLIDKLLADAKIEKGYSLLKEAAEIYKPRDAKKAIALFQQAKPLLPRDGKREVSRFYSDYVKLLENTGQTAEAAKVQAEYVALAGVGNDDLARLYYLSKSTTELDALLTSLKQADASESAITSVGNELLKLYWQDKKANLDAAARMTELLEHYLAMQRERKLDNELSARIALGRVYIEQKKNVEARKALEIGHLDMTKSGQMTKHSLETIEQLKQKTLVEAM